MLPQLDCFVAAVVRHFAQGGRAMIAGNSLGGVAGLRAAQDASLPLAGTVAISPAGLGHQRWVDWRWPRTRPSTAGVRTSRA